MVLETQYNFFTLLGKGVTPFWMIPGFEGAKCTLAGAKQEGWPSWNHYDEYVEAQSSNEIAYHEYATSWDKVYFVNSDPNNQLIAWDYKRIDLGVDRIQMLVETEQSVQLENLGRMGDPLNWNETEQFDVTQYEPNEDRDLTKTVSGEETHYTLTKKSILLVPAEIHISISIPPANDHSSHDSRWQEGTWPNLELWFQLDFITWNTLAQPYAQIDGMSEWEASYYATNPANSFNEGSSYDQKGGFPIAGWVQGYLENVGPDWPEDWDDEIWDQINTDIGHDHYLTESSKSTLNALTQTIPALQGRAITLYSSAADPYQAYEGGYEGFQVILDQARVYPFVPSQVPAYFPITVQTLGTLAQGSWPGPYDIYYPAINYRIRVIYAVYGTFTYLWTVKTAEDNGYPGWETREYEWVHTEDPLGWLKDILSNPTFLLFLFLFVVLIILVLLAIFMPGLLKLGSAAAERGAQHMRPRRQPPPPPSFYYGLR